MAEGLDNEAERCRGENQNEIPLVRHTLICLLLTPKHQTVSHNLVHGFGARGVELVHSRYSVTHKKN